MWELRQGDALERLREMPAESVQCVVTSPPYFGLRDYGTGEWEGGDSMCKHERQSVASRLSSGLDGSKDTQGGVVAFRYVCGHCGAARRDRQIGLEASPDEYVAALVAVFREIRRVLRDDGTVWLNLGDSYARPWGAQSRPLGDASTLTRNGGVGPNPKMLRHAAQIAAHPKRQTQTGAIPAGANYKAKDLLGIPWLVAFALRADGWYLRSEIIWFKPNPMPESVTDRPTSAQEKLILLAKNAHYFYDADAIREPCVVGMAIDRVPAVGSNSRQADSPYREGLVAAKNGSNLAVPPNGRNKRNVWEIATQPYAQAHFATFPPKLVEPCVLAGSAECDTILDPFAGAGTVGVVALRHNRSFIGIELNAAYVDLARQRIRDDAPLLNAHIEAAA